MTTAQATFDAFCLDLGRRQPTPGGGAAAAAAAAIGSALGAMAAAYTTGPKWAEREAEATALAADLRQAAATMLVRADADTRAYAALARSWRDDSLPQGERMAIADTARAVPADLLADCARHAATLQDFLPRCNPRIVSDARAAIHLLAGAGRAAFQTLLVNDPPAPMHDQAQQDLARLSAAEADCAISG
ncbi:MAG: cyclodeaminase/cyclohydrolase family protein [Planctomycetota bacterium]